MAENQQDDVGGQRETSRSPRRSTLGLERREAAFAVIGTVPTGEAEWLAYQLASAYQSNDERPLFTDQRRLEIQQEEARRRAREAWRPPGPRSIIVPSVPVVDDTRASIPATQPSQPSPVASSMQATPGDSSGPERWLDGDTAIDDNR